MTDLFILKRLFKIKKRVKETWYRNSGIYEHAIVFNTIAII